MYDSHSNIWHAPLYWAHLLCQGQSGCCGLAQRGGGVAGGAGERGESEMGAGRGSQSHSCHQIGWVGFNFGPSVLALSLLKRLQAHFVPGQNPVIKALCFDKYVHCELDPVLPWSVG